MTMRSSPRNCSRRSAPMIWPNSDLLPEFIGRLPVVSVLEELTEDDLARILAEPENALVKQYRSYSPSTG